MNDFRGLCITNGSFADLSVPWAGTFTVEHCLLRSFFKSVELKKWTDTYEDIVLSTVIDATTFEEFRQRLEDQPGLSLPHILYGNFSVGSAPIGQ